MRPPANAPYDVREQLERIESAITKIEHLLTGNGDPSKGMIVRVDRLEQSEQRRNWLTRTALGAAVTSFVGFVWGLLKG